MEPFPRVVDEFPDLAAELRTGLIEDGYEDLADQVDGLRVHRVCDCGGSRCTSFATSPPGEWEQSPNGFSLTPPVKWGMVILDVVDDLIRYVEVLERGRMRPAHRALLRRMSRNL